MAFSREAYGATAIKQALSRDQYGKCCYCESKLGHVYHGDVEHYRPKGAISSGTLRLLPGYYWLAYEWSNLFFACASCNQSYKRDQFPLSDETLRAANHEDDVQGETPLLLNPSGPEDPRNHIRFRRDLPIGVTPTGAETIRLVGLTREQLTLKRLGHLRLIETLCDVLLVLQNDDRPGSAAIIYGIRGQLREAISPRAEFSAATSDLVDSKLPPHSLTL